MKITKRQLRRIIREELSYLDNSNLNRLDELSLEDVWNNAKGWFDKAVQTGEMTADMAKRDFTSWKEMGAKGAEALQAAQAGGKPKEVLEPFLPEIRQKIIDYIATDGAKMAAAEVDADKIVPPALRNLSSDLDEWVTNFEAELKTEIQNTVSGMAIDIADVVVRNLAPT